MGTPSEPADVALTAWLRRMSGGDKEATEVVASAVYEELHRLAVMVMTGENRNYSLQPTLLVNEVFLRLLRGEPIDWQSRSHFYTLAARMMRRILIDHFRQKGARKRPPSSARINIEDAILITETRCDEVLMVDQALDSLAELDPRAASVVELRYFGGLSAEETAEVLGVHERTVKRDWQFAQVWLKRFFDGHASRAQLA